MICKHNDEERNLRDALRKLCNAILLPIIIGVITALLFRVPIVQRIMDLFFNLPLIAEYSDWLQNILQDLESFGFIWEIIGSIIFVLPFIAITCLIVFSMGFLIRFYKKSK